MFRVPKESTPFYRLRPISRCFMTLKQIQIMDQAKTMHWIFVQNLIQMDLVQYKVLHMTF